MTGETLYNLVIASFNEHLYYGIKMLYFPKIILSIMHNLNLHIHKQALTVSFPREERWEGNRFFFFFESVWSLELFIPKRELLFTFGGSIKTFFSFVG